MKNSKVSFTTNQKIIHHLMLESNQLKSLGLLDGKMGLIIFFYHYARYTDNIIFEDFANDLLDGLLENIHKELPLTFTSGLSGIAWGIEYLIQNRFIEGDSNEICEELDKKIISADPRHLEDYSLETGLEGIAHCVVARINGAIRQNNPVSFDSIYINDLIYALKISLHKEKSIGSDQLFQWLVSSISKGKYVEYFFNIKSFIEIPEIKEKNIRSFPLGLKKGLAGYLLGQII